MLRLRRREGRRVSSDEPFRAEALAHLDSLYGLALRLSRDRATAEDLVQETYLRAFQAASRFERGTNLKAWLMTILLNTFRNLQRRAARSPIDASSEIVDRAEASDPFDHNPEQRLLRETLDTDLQDALDALPDVYRQAVWLRDVEELAYAEIGRAMEVPIGTVMSRIARGRRLLYDHLTRHRKAAGPVPGQVPGLGPDHEPGPGRAAPGADEAASGPPPRRRSLDFRWIRGGTGRGAGAS